MEMRFSSQKKTGKSSPLSLHHHSSRENLPNNICSPSVSLCLKCDDGPREVISVGDQTPRMRHLVQDSGWLQHLVEWCQCFVTRARASTAPESSSRSAHAIAVLQSVGQMSCVYLSVRKNV